MEKAHENTGRVIELGGRTLVLWYSLNSLCEIEDKAGMSLELLMDRQFSAMRLLLWAGLRRCQPELSVWDVGELIGEAMLRGDSMERIINLCALGMRDAGLIGE